MRHNLVNNGDMRLSGRVEKDKFDIMTSKQSPKKPPYTFRAGWALLLLAINFVVAAYYFGILQ